MKCIVGAVMVVLLSGCGLRADTVGPPVWLPCPAVEISVPRLAEVMVQRPDTGTAIEAVERYVVAVDKRDAAHRIAEQAFVDNRQACLEVDE